MRLDRMLWHCLLPGATAHEETGTKVRLEPASDESVLFFKIDGPEFREGDADMRVADLLVVARKADVGRAVMMYVELKGSPRNTADALEQLQSAIEKIEPLLPPDCRPEGVREVQVVVALASNTPPSREWRRQEEFRRRIRQATGRHVALRFRSGATLTRPADLREHLPAGWL